MLSLYICLQCRNSYSHNLVLTYSYWVLLIYWGRRISYSPVSQWKCGCMLRTCHCLDARFCLRTCAASFCSVACVSWTIDGAVSSHRFVMAFCPVATLVGIVSSSLVDVVLVVSVCFGICASADMFAVKVTLVFWDVFTLDVCSCALYSSRPLERLSFIWVRSVLSMSSARVIEVVKVMTRRWFARVPWTLFKHVWMRRFCMIDD